MAIRIVLTDDHKLILQRFKELLDEEADFKVVGTTSDGLDAVTLVKNLHPDVLVTDISMPGLNGIQLTRKVRSLSPKTAIVVHSWHNDEWYTNEAFKAGAVAYVAKESSTDSLKTAIREVVAHHCYMDPSISRTLLFG